MKKYFKILILIIFSNVFFSIANAGSDGTFEIEKKQIQMKLMIVLKKLIEEYLLLTKVLTKLFLNH